MKTAKEWGQTTRIEFPNSEAFFAAIQRDVIITALDIVASSKDKFIAQSKLRDLIINNVQEPAPKS